MRRQDMMVLGIAVGAGLVAFVLMANLLKKSSSAPKLSAVTAAQIIPMGKPIETTDLALAPITDAKMNPTELYFQGVDVVGSEALEDIPKGAFVLRSQVKAPAPPAAEEKRDIALPIPEGMRAYTLSLQDIENLPDLLNVGSYVDILGIVTNNEGKTELQTIIRGSQVISMSRTDEKKDVNGAVIVPSQIKTVTLSLNPIGSEVVTKAIQLGKIRLIVRADGGEGSVLQSESIKYTEIIRGVEKQRIMRNEDRFMEDQSMAGKLKDTVLGTDDEYVQ